MKGQYLILFLLLIGLTTRSQAQVGQEKVKAALLYYFGEYITWPENKQEQPEFHIGILGQAPTLQTELQTIARKHKLKQQAIRIHQYSQFDKVPKEKLHIIYISKNYPHNIIEVINELKPYATLVVTDSYPEQLFIMINFFYSPEKKAINFELNQKNLQDANLKYAPELMSQGGSLVDVRKLYLLTYNRLRKEMNKLSDFEEEITQLKKERDIYRSQSDSLSNVLDSLVMSIDVMRAQLDGFYNKVKQMILHRDSLSQEIDNREQLISKRGKALQLQRARQQELLNEIAGYDNQVQQAGNRLDSLNILIKEKQQEVKNKEEVISQQDNMLITQRNRIYIFLGLIIILLLAAFFIYRAYWVNKNLKINLEQLVKARTRELEISQQHYISIFENTPVALWEVDFSDLLNFIQSLGMKSEEEFIQWLQQDKRQTYTLLQHVRLQNVNQATTKLFEAHDKQQFIQSFHRIFNEHSLQFIHATGAALLAKQQSLTQETRGQTLNKKHKHLIASWNILPGYEDNYSKILVSLMDITHLKNLELELIDHRNHLEKLVQERTEKLEATNDELNATNEELYYTNDRLAEQKETLEKQKQVLEKTVNELQKTQAQLIQSEKMAALGVLVSGVAHEINNPVNFISSSLVGLKNNMQALIDWVNLYRALPKGATGEQVKEVNDFLSPEDQQTLLGMLPEAINTMEIGVDRTKKIVKSLRSFARSDDQFEDNHDVHQNLENTLVILYNQYKNRIAIDKHFGEISNIRCQPGKINQVFMNILTNAIQAIEGEGTISITTQPYNQSQILIRICDTGTGIPQEQQNKIFDPFYTTKDIGVGTGLGLSISYNIIQEHKGTLEFDSKPQKGTCFSIYLPINPDGKG